MVGLQITLSCGTLYFIFSDFLPLFIWVLIHADFCKAEVEAEYMWGLVHPSLLNGEGGYYLTTLTSAVNVLKETQFGPEDNQEVKDVCESVYTVYTTCLHWGFFIL